MPEVFKWMCSTHCWRLPLQRNRHGQHRDLRPCDKLLDRFRKLEPGQGCCICYCAYRRYRYRCISSKIFACNLIHCKGQSWRLENQKLFGPENISVHLPSFCMCSACPTPMFTTVSSSTEIEFTLLGIAVLIAGGYLAGVNATNTAELWNPLTGTWSYTGSMTTPRLLFQMLNVPGSGDTQGASLLHLHQASHIPACKLTQTQHQLKVLAPGAISFLQAPKVTMLCLIDWILTARSSVQPMQLGAVQIWATH